MLRSLLARLAPQRGTRLLRTLVGEIIGIRAALERQADLLARLADHVAPETPTRQIHAAHVANTPTTLDAGVSFLDGIDAGLVQDYVEATTVALGRPPDDDEILAYLADEKTQDLHQRLHDREARIHLDRLMRHQDQTRAVP